MVSFSLWGSKEPTATQTPAAKPDSTPVAPPPLSTTQSADPTSSPTFGLNKEPIPPYPDVFSKRSLKQLGFFFSGAGFMLLTAIATKRAAARHMKSSALKFYQPTHTGISHGAPNAIKGERDPMIAFEALSLATLGTISFGIMGVGGIAWAFDITNLKELQTKARRSMYGDQGRVDKEAEKEVAEWLVKFLEPNLQAEVANLKAEAAKAESIPEEPKKP